MEKFPGSIKNSFRNSQGQMAIEAVLLMTILVGVFLVISNYISSQKVVQKLADPAAARLGAMISFGTWKPDGCTAPGHPTQTIGKCHPNSIQRSLSSAPGP